MSVFMGFVWVRGCLKSLNRKILQYRFFILRFEVRYENMINKSHKVRACFDFANILLSSSQPRYVKDPRSTIRTYQKELPPELTARIIMDEVELGVVGGEWACITAVSFHE